MRTRTTITANGEWDCWDIDFYFNDTLAGLKKRKVKPWTRRRPSDKGERRRDWLTPWLT